MVAIEVVEGGHHIRCGAFFFSTMCCISQGYAIDSLTLLHWPCLMLIVHLQSVKWSKYIRGIFRRGQIARPPPLGLLPPRVTLMARRLVFLTPTSSPVRCPPWLLRRPPRRHLPPVLTTSLDHLYTLEKLIGVPPPPPSQTPRP
jgi:hypothetical protein